MFRAMFSPTFRSNLTVYTDMVQCTDLLPTGDTAEMEMHCRKSVCTVQLLLNMGEKIARNM
jgi:hypothetical protein